MMTRCIRPRGGALWPLALPMIPYMRANLARKRSGLAAADAIIAVSTTIAADLRARAPEISATQARDHPQPGRRRRLCAHARPRRPPPVQGPYALYLGKLAPNKGTSASRRRRRTRAPRLAARHRRRRSRSRGHRSTGQTLRPRHSLHRLGRPGADDRLARARFAARLPVAGPGVAQPRADRGQRARRADCRHEHRRHARHREARGDRAAVVNSRSAGSDVRRLVDDPTRRRQLGDAARDHAAATFDADTVVERVESLYMDLLSSVKMRAR